MRSWFLALALGIAITAGSLVVWSHLTGNASGQTPQATWQIKKFDPTDADGTMNRDPTNLQLTVDPDKYVNDFLATLSASCSVQVLPSSFVAPWYVAWVCP
jgi:hypothetical protein